MCVYMRACVCACVCLFCFVFRECFFCFSMMTGTVVRRAHAGHDRAGADWVPGARRAVGARQARGLQAGVRVCRGKVGQGGGLPETAKPVDW